MSFRVLKFLIKHLIKTRSVIIKFEGNDHLIDNGTDPLILQINNKKFLNKIFYAPSLVLTEGYMDKDYELSNSTFYEFSELLIENYNKYLEKISNTLIFRIILIINPLFQLNFVKSSKSNVAVTTTYLIGCMTYFWMKLGNIHAHTLKMKTIH